MEPTLTSADRRRLKGEAQRLEPILKVGHQGLSEAFVAGVDRELAARGLIKIKFADFKEEKKELSAKLAEMTGAALLQIVGHVAVFYRPKKAAEKSGSKAAE